MRSAFLAVLALTAACGIHRTAPILLFNGTGVSANDVKAFEALLNKEGLPYETADSRQLNSITEAGLRRHRLLIVPGGNFEHIGNNLTPAAAATIRSAVNNGLNYLGVCAGAFFAGNSPYNGLNLTGGKRFDFYAAEAQGVRKAAVSITDASGRTIQHYWEDGPHLAGWGAVVAKYPDGTPAVVEGEVGKGWVILTGVHPEAPAGWREGMTFQTPVEVSNRYAVGLIRAALNEERLPRFER